MSKNNKISKIDLIKAPFLQLGKGAIAKGLLDYLFVGAGITSTPISIPLIAGLFVAYAGINCFEGKDKVAKQKIITDEFEKRFDEIKNYLKKDKDTQIAELSHILEIELKQENVYDSIEYLKEETNKQSAKFYAISRQITFTQGELSNFKIQLETHLNLITETVKNIDKTTARTEFKLDKSTEEIKTHTSKEIQSLEKRMTENFGNKLQELLQSNTTSLNTATSGGYDPQMANQLEKITVDEDLISDLRHNQDLTIKKTNNIQDPSFPKNICSRITKSFVAKNRTSKNIFELFNKFQTQMLSKNYSEALKLSNELEMYADGLKVDDIKPYIYVLLARLNINYYETNIKLDRQYLDKAKELLQNAELTVQGDLLDCVEALKAIIAGFEGSGSILEILNAKTNPYAMRARIATLCEEKKYTDAVNLIKEQEKVHEYWAESAIIAYLFAEQDEIADQILKEMKETSEYSSFIICSQKYAEILSLRIAQHQQDADAVDTKIDAEKILRLLTPVLEESTRTKNNQGIFQIATEIALQTNLLLGNAEEIKRYSNLLLSQTPIPLVVLESIIRQYIQPPENILKRIRNEYKSNINAHLLAATIQAQCFNEPAKAFLALKKVADLAKTEQEKETTVNCLLDLWQHLDVKLADDCCDLAMNLCKLGSLSTLKFKAGKHLRDNQPDKVFELLKDQPKDDPVILQMKGNAFFQRNQFPEAGKCFRRTAEIVNSAEMYHKAGDFFLQGNDEPPAIECYEKSIALFPDNVTVRSNLADIYTRTSIDLKQAIIHLSTLDDLKPNDSKVLINLATCYARLFEPEKSLEYYDKACEVDNPMLAAVAWKAELLISLKKEDEAFKHLESFKDKFKENSAFLAVYMNTAHFAGFDDQAHQAMMKILKLQKKDSQQKQIIQMFPAQKGLDMFKERIQESNKRDIDVHEQMLKGQFPWLWAESVNGNKNYYWGWKKRTNEFRWLSEEPVNRAKYTIYATNGFHSQKDKGKRISLLPIKCPPAKSDIVFDISALITLYELNLLDDAFDYFNKIIIPEEYLEAVLEQGKSILLHQKSRLIIAKQIKTSIEQGTISVLPETQKTNDFILVDEHYSEPSEEKHHIRDILNPLFKSGSINENTFKNAQKVCSKPARLEENALLPFKGRIKIELSTLGTLTNIGLLKQVCNFFNIHISQADNAENNQIISGTNLQNEVFDQQHNLWKQLKANPKVEFERVKKVQDNVADVDVENALSASTLARGGNYSFMVDDRVLQALLFNESQEVEFPAFGTDALILDLLGKKKISREKALNSIIKLMKWRYRFIVISPELLLEAALKYANHPPGKELHLIAEYIQECMSDPGLFTGREKTKLGESMAFRLYLTWSRNIAEFIALVWKEKHIDEEFAETITIWAINELLPSPPKALHGSQKTNLENLTPRQIFSNILISIWMEKDNKQIKNAMKVIQECFGLNNEEYSMIILEILNDVAKTLPPNADKNAIKTNQIMKERILAIAFSHIEKIDIRTLIPLQQLNLSDIKLDPIGEDIDLEIIRNPNHEQRIPLLPGPLLIYQSKDKTENFIVETKTLFCSSLKNIRQAVLEYYEKMIAANLLHIAPKTKNILKTERNGFLLTTDSTWKPAALAIYDALNNDVSLFIAGVMQITHTQLEIKDFLNTYVPKILHPQMQTLDFTELVVNIPEQEHENIHQFLEDITNKSETIPDLCQSYYIKLGHLPLAPKFSLGRVVKTWIDKNKKQEIWDEVWDWGDSTFSPLPQYHACSVFVLYPELIPSRKLLELWAKIKSVICDSDVKNKDASLYEAWRLRKDLNRHFTFHIEANLPGYDGSHIANFVLWLTERVSCLFGDDPELISMYRKKWIANALDASTRVWLAASPSENNSDLRYINHVIPSPWGMSLMCLLGDNFEKLKPTSLNKGLAKDINNAFADYMLIALPFNVKKPKNPTYAFQLPLPKTINKWKKIQSEEQKKSYNHLLKTNKKLSNNETFIKDFKDIAAKTFIDQMFLASAFKNKAFTNPAIDDAVSQVLSNAEWRNKNLLSVHENTLGVIIEALSILQVNTKNDWAFYLPHYLAEICEKTEDKKNLEMLFYYVIHSCLTSDNFSAIRRLLTGKDAGNYLKYVEEYRQRVKEMKNYYPLWVVGKLRALLATMNIY